MHSDLSGPFFLLWVHGTAATLLDRPSTLSGWGFGIAALACGCSGAAPEGALSDGTSALSPVRACQRLLAAAPVSISALCKAPTISATATGRARRPSNASNVPNAVARSASVGLQAACAAGGARLPELRWGAGPSPQCTIAVASRRAFASKSRSSRRTWTEASAKLSAVMNATWGFHSASSSARHATSSAPSTSGASPSGSRQARATVSCTLPWNSLSISHAEGGWPSARRRASAHTPGGVCGKRSCTCSSRSAVERSPPTFKRRAAYASVRPSETSVLRLARSR
mmetsp:Transcript_13525/g.37492  ORF Transcript_13525/g.37492 Transcript_13525/m.37492 type:complete len:285 (-) Transcript_13525:1607-2461(-)